MKLCWSFDDKNRPSFSELLKDLEAIRMTYQCQQEAIAAGSGGTSQCTTVHNKNYNLMPDEMTMMTNPAFVFNNMLPFDSDEMDSPVTQSRLTSATLVLDSTPPPTRPASMINTAYHNFNKRPTPICEPNLNGICAQLDAASDINDNFVDFDGYQLPKTVR